MLRFLLPCAVALLSVPAASHAAAVLESVVGDVRAVVDGKKTAVLRQGQAVSSRTTLITGVDGAAILRFDDEQKLMLAPNSELEIVDSHYKESAAALDRAEMVLQRGALRTVSGLIARRNADMFVVRTAHVNLGVRGTDFSLTVIGQSYWSVNEGAVVASTNAGKGAFGKGAYGRSASIDRLAAGVSSAGLPVAVLALFNEINSPKVTAQLGPGPAPGGSMTGAAPSTEAAPRSTGLGAAGMLGIAAAVAAALAAAGGGGSDGGSATAVRH
jgi:hypothetical protein